MHVRSCRRVCLPVSHGLRRLVPQLCAACTTGMAPDLAVAGGWGRVLLQGAGQACSACSARCCPAALDRLAARHMCVCVSPNPMTAAGLYAVLLCWLLLPPRAASGLTAPVHAR